jgi:hypothetical protein
MSVHRFWTTAHSPPFLSPPLLERTRVFSGLLPLSSGGFTRQSGRGRVAVGLFIVGVGVLAFVLVGAFVPGS